MRVRTLLACALASGGCLGADWGGQSGAETTSVQSGCAVVDSEPVTDPSQAVGGLSFSIDKLSRRTAGAFSGALTVDGQQHDQFADVRVLDGATWVTRQGDEGPCDPAYVVPVEVEVSGALRGSFTFEAVVLHKDWIQLPEHGHNVDVQTELESPFTSSTISWAGSFSHKDGAGSVDWSTGAHSEPLGDWWMERD